MSRQHVAYGNFTPEFVHSLASLASGKRVLEVFAGNGLLAGKLREQGCDILSTSLFSGHDGRWEHGLHSDVVECEASAAVIEYGAECDLLLMSWPVATEAAVKCAMAWGAICPGKPICFIGEMPRDNSTSQIDLPGCASDNFFEATEVQSAVEGYTPRNMLDRAVLLQPRPEYVQDFQEGCGIFTPVTLDYHIGRMMP